MKSFLLILSYTIILVHQALPHGHILSEHQDSGVVSDHHKHAHHHHAEKHSHEKPESDNSDKEPPFSHVLSAIEEGIFFNDSREIIIENKADRYFSPEYFSASVCFQILPLYLPDPQLFSTSDYYSGPLILLKALRAPPAC